MTSAVITYQCGHEGDLDLTKKRRDQWAGYKRWASDTLLCRTCFQAQNATSRDEFLAQLDIERVQWETAAGLPPLDGANERAVLWGHRSRYRLLCAAWEELSLTEDEYAATLAEPAANIRSAGWWIDQRDEPVIDLAEILAAYEPQNDATITSENPY